MKTEARDFQSLTESGMHEAGRSIGATLSGGEVLALVGHLGAGKTHFSKGLVSGVGSDVDEVTSPTFSLVNEYRTGKLPVYHFDFYRMDTAEEVIQIGWEEYLDDSSAVVIVEWADKFEELLPDDTQWFQIEIAEGSTRNIFRKK